MIKSNVTIEKTGFRNLLYGGIAMIVYFLILKLVGLAGNDTVRFLSSIFIVIAAVMGIFYYSRHKSKGMFYLNGLGIGFIAGLVAAVTNGIFMFIYSYFIDQEFMADLRINDFFGSNLSPLMIFGANALMGMMIGAFSGYISMMYFDRSRREASDF